jgi:hypothetical protein
VNGNFRRQIATNTSTYFYPIGNGTNTTDRHLAALINNNLAGGGISFINGSVRDFNQTAPNNDANLNTTQNINPLNSTAGEVIGQTVIWNFTPNAAPTAGSYGVRLYVENTTLSATDDNTFCPLKRNNTSTYANFLSLDATTSIPNAGSAGRTYNAGNGYAQRTGYTSFSEYIIAKNSSWVLPIELVSFDGVCENGKVNLKWSTASETNNDFFSIEKTIDGISYSLLGTIDGASNSVRTLNYSFNDNNPVESTSYYRLKQTDFDGKYKYSDVISVDCNQIRSGNIISYPNPASHNVTIELPGNSKILPVEIINARGQIIYSGTITNKINLPTSELISGIYFIKIITDYKVLTEKIIIEK